MYQESQFLNENKKHQTIIAINERIEMNSIEQCACTPYSIVTFGRFFL